MDFITGLIIGCFIFNEKDRNENSGNSVNFLGINMLLLSIVNIVLTIFILMKNQLMVYKQALLIYFLVQFAMVLLFVILLSQKLMLSADIYVIEKTKKIIKYSAFPIVLELLTILIGMVSISG